MFSHLPEKGLFGGKGPRFRLREQAPVLAALQTGLWSFFIEHVQLTKTKQLPAESSPVSVKPQFNWQVSLASLPTGP